MGGDGGIVDRLRLLPAGARTALVCAVMAASVSWVPQSAQAKADFNPVAGDGGFLALVQHGATLYSGSDDGGMAVGGDLSVGGPYRLAADHAGDFGARGGSTDTGLLVGGSIHWPAGATTAIVKVRSGPVQIGSPSGSAVAGSSAEGTDVTSATQGSVRTPYLATEESPRTSAIARPAPVDFAAAFESFRARSATMARCDGNVALTDAHGQILPSAPPPHTAAYLNTLPGAVNVLDISATDLTRLSSVTFQHAPNSSSPLVVNVDTTGVGDDFAWTPPSFGGVADVEARYILFNFPTAKRVAVEGSPSVAGTVYAPSASLSEHGGAQIDGSVIADAFTQGEPGDQAAESRIRDFPFAASVHACALSRATPAPSADTAGPGAVAPVPSASTSPGATPTLGATAPATGRERGAGVQPRVVGGVVNGGFETGSLSGWTSTPPFGGPTVENVTVHSGTWAASAAPSPLGDESISQTFTAPTDTNALSFWYDQTICTNPAVDWATATLKNNTTSITTTPLPHTCPASLPGWVQVVVPVVAGDSYTLTLMNHNGGGFGDQTTTLFDDAETMGLTIAKTADVSSTTPGSTVHYTITVTNTGQTAYTGAAFSDSLTGVLDDATYNNNAAATVGTVAYTSPNLTWSGNLAVGAVATITYSATVNSLDTGDAALTNSISSSTAGTNCTTRTTLGFLISASNGPATGTGTIYYTDGSTQSYTLTAPDWFSTTPPTGGAVAVNSLYSQRAGATNYVHTADIFSVPITLTAGKTLSHLTLPAVGVLSSSTPALHVFAISGVSAAGLSSSFNDVGISNDSAPTVGSFDGYAGDTFSEQALTSAGAAPGATISSSGNSFTFPNVAAGTNDNIVANGQNITVTGSDVRCTATVTDVVPAVLSITVPSTTNLGSTTPGNSLSAAMGTVTVLDQRGLTNASWTATVSTTSFATGGGTGPETITGASVSYWSGPATSTTGTATVTPGQANAAAAQTLTTARTAFTSTTGSGSTIAAWNPTLVVNVPAGAVAGTYTAVVTHSVA